MKSRETNTRACREEGKGLCMLTLMLEENRLQGVVQQRLPLKSVCSQVGNSPLAVPAFLRSLHHIQVSPRWCAGVALPVRVCMLFLSDRRLMSRKSK